MYYFHWPFAAFMIETSYDVAVYRINQVHIDEWYFI
jgi:hypothetical protein